MKEFLIVIFILPLLFIIALYAGSRNTIKGPVECTGRHSDMAFLMLQNDITKLLHSSSTARYPSTAQGRAYDGDCIYEIRSYVDVQNSFDAVIRTKWYGKIRRNPEKNSWTMIEAKMVKQEVGEL